MNKRHLLTAMNKAESIVSTSRTEQEFTLACAVVTSLRQAVDNLDTLDRYRALPWVRELCQSTERRSK